MELLINYIPYARNVEIRNIHVILKSLKTLVFLLDISIDAIEAYEKRLYHMFDPQVSENLCQIRAFKNFLLFDANQDDCFHDYLLKQKNLIFRHKSYITMVIKSLINKCDCKKHRFSINKHETIRAYMEERFSEIRFDQFLEYITFSFILTKYSLIGDDGISIGMNYKLLSQDLDINSTTYSSKLVHKLQRSLSFISTELIFNLIEKNNQGETFWNMMKLFHQKDEILRHVLPCYYVTDIILKHIQIFYRKLPIIICVFFKDKPPFIVPFYLNDSGFFYNITILKEEYKNKACIVFEGVSENFDDIDEDKWISNFLRTDLMETIKMNMAAHPQYSGKKLDRLKKNPFLINRGILKQYGLTEIENNPAIFLEEYNFLKYQKKASLYGCSVENSSLFLIKHIYCASPKHLIEKYSEPTLQTLKKEEKSVSYI